MAERILMNEFKALQKEPWTHVELIKENIFQWSVALIVMNETSLYYGGYFKAKMTFPKTYPYSPPDFKFNRPLYHPNIYPDGRLCISILHTPGDDEMSGELAAERWNPAQRVETVLLSVLSLLDDAEVSSPANVDAGVMLRQNPEKYKTMVQKDMETSKKDIPEGFVMPKSEDAFKAAKEEDYNLDSMDWADSDAGSVDFGSDADFDSDEDLEGMDCGSDSEVLQEEDDEDDEDEE